MDEILAAIDDALARKGLSDAAASQLAVGNFALIKNLRNSRASEPEQRRTNFQALQRLADVLDLEIYFGPKREIGNIPPEADGREFAQVPLHAAWLAAGNGVTNGSEEVIEHLAFRRDWLKKNRISASSACLARVIGESMQPTICEGDMVLIDTAKTVPVGKVRLSEDHRSASIYALIHNGEARVKRIDRYGPDELLLISDNKMHPTEKVHQSSLTIVGKVMWWGHTNRE